MSNFVNLAMQNSQAEQARKRRKKEEMEESLLGGGSGGSSDSSSSQEDLGDSGSSSSSSSYSSQYSQASVGSSGGNLIAQMGQAVMSEVANNVADKVTDKIVDKVDDALVKGGKEVLEKAGKELLEEGAETLGKKCLGKLAAKGAGYLGSLVGGPIGWAIGAVNLAKDIYDLANLGSELLTDKSLGEHVKDVLKGEEYEPEEWEEEYKAKGNTVDISDTLEKHREEKKKKKEIEAAEKKKKEAEEKLKKEKEAKEAKEAEKKKTSNAEQDEEDEDEEEDDSDSTSSNSSLKRGLKSGLMHTMGTLGGSAAISFSMIGAYRVHYMGEFEYKGISAEYQRQDKDYQNFTTYDGNGDVVLTGLSRENKLIKTFYTKYSDKSYYAIVEDSKKYSNIDDAYKRKNILTPDELREQYPDIEDVNNREVMFQINPDVLYTLDKYIHNDKVLYPQQFVKPVYYEESQEKFGLKDLVDNKGKILAKSQVFDNNGKPIKNSNGTFKTTEGIWDYGFAPILRYQEHEVETREIKNPIKRDVKVVSENVEVSSGKIEDKAPESGPIPGEDSVVGNTTIRPKPAYIIDTAVTPGGTITNKIEKRWVKDASSVKNSTEKHTYSVKVGEVDEYCPIPETEEPSVGDVLETIRTSSEVPEGMEVCGKKDIYNVYEVTDHYETYVEENLPQYVGDPDTKDITGSEYFRDYMNSYTNYFPSKLPTRLDFRVLDNENISKLIYDDTPGQVSTGIQQETNLTGEVFAAEFSAYYPSNDPMQGGFNDAKGERLDPSKNTCAAPWSDKYPKSLLTYGSKIQIQGTGTEKDGVVCTINDKGSAITLEEQADGTLKYKIDILFPDRKSAYDFGRRQGQIIIPTTNTPAVASVNESGNVVKQERTPETLMNNYERSQSRAATLITNTGGNAVTNYGMTIDDFASGRASYMAGKSCDSNNCTLANYRENLEPMAFQDKVGDLRHLRLDSYRPVNEEVFKKMFSEKFSKIGQYGAALIEAGKKTNVDIMAKTAQMALESGWGKHAIVGSLGGKTYYNFAGIGAYDGDAYNKGLQYAAKQGWDTPEKGMIGVIEWVSKNYIYNEEYKQNTLYKFQFTPGNYKRFYASSPEYSYSIANIMQNSIIAKYPDIYAPNAQYYFDFPEFDPNKPVGTVEGAGYVPGGGGSYSTGGTANTAFNSYLSSNWSAIESVWDELFPGQSELDASLDLVKKGDYTELYNNYEEKAKYMEEPGLKTRANNMVTLPRNKTVYTSNLGKIGSQLALNMMFALNQGNYLFKYDNMTEMEWKAMYTQLLSSPTGQTWDDKWIGFNKEDIFGIKDVGTLFREDAGVSPVISVPYGMEKNTISGDASITSQYNFTNFGIDIVVPPETEVLTVADGKVIAMSNKNDVDSRYGNYVEIQHANGTQTITANLKSVSVKLGDQLKKGDVIGLSGGDCKSYKDNALHYQIRHNGSLINPTWIITGEMTGFEDPISGNSGVYCGGGGATVEVSNNPVVNNALSIARQKVGSPYVWGATGPNSFDCSGFMYYIMKEAGVSGGRRVAYGYYKESTEIPREQIQPGDFVFWHDLKGTRHSPVYHIGVYLGGGEVIDCSTDHKGVGTRKLDDLVDVPGNRKFTIGRYAPFVGGGAGSAGMVSSGGGCTTSSTIAVMNDYQWPVPDSSTISTAYGNVTNPDTGKKEMHNGIDISGTEGSDIVASKDGTVIYSGEDGDYGKIIKIKHGDKSETWYAHNSENIVKEGDNVTKGQSIAKMGSTGSAKTTHVHFEVRYDGEPKNPSNYVKP